MGTALRIRASKLDEIEADNKKEAAECLSCTILEYLRMCYNVKKHGEPSWQKIVQAVQHQSGGNNRALALSIAKDHLLAGKRSSIIDSTYMDMNVIV